MDGWWWLYGGPSLGAGVGLGLLWAVCSTARRRRKFAQAGLQPSSQWLWLATNFLSMGGYITLLTALSLLAVHDAIESHTMWLMFGAAALAFCSALLFPRFELPQYVTQRAPVEKPSRQPLRKSA